VAEKAPQAGLKRNAANYAPLTPLSFLRRAADISRDRTAIVYGERRWNWGEVDQRCRRFASALKQRGIGTGLRRMMCSAFQEHALHHGDD